MEIRIH